MPVGCCFSHASFASVGLCVMAAPVTSASSASQRFRPLRMVSKVNHEAARQRLRTKTEELLRREAVQCDQLLFAQRRNMARRDTCRYITALVEDDKKLKKWADLRTERHLWVEAAIHLQAAWISRGSTDFHAEKCRRRHAAQASARKRVMQALAEICLLRAEVHRIAVEFFVQIAPSLAKKVHTLRQRLTAFSKSAGRGGHAHKQMIEAVKTLQVEILGAEQELHQLEQLMIRLQDYSKAEQRELKRAQHRWRALIKDAKGGAERKAERLSYLRSFLDKSEGRAPLAPSAAVGVAPAAAALPDAGLEDVNSEEDEREDSTAEAPAPPTRLLKSSGLAILRQVSEGKTRPPGSSMGAVVLGARLHDLGREPTLTDAMSDFHLAQNALDQAKAVRAEIANVEEQASAVSAIRAQIRAMHPRAALHYHIVDTPQVNWVETDRSELEVAPEHPDTDVAGGALMLALRVPTAPGKDEEVVLAMGEPLEVESAAMGVGTTEVGDGGHARASSASAVPREVAGDGSEASACHTTADHTIGHAGHESKASPRPRGKGAWDCLPIGTSQLMGSYFEHTFLGQVVPLYALVEKGDDKSMAARRKTPHEPRHANAVRSRQHAKHPKHMVGSTQRMPLSRSRAPQSVHTSPQAVDGVSGVGLDGGSSVPLLAAAGQTPVPREDMAVYQQLTSDAAALLVRLDPEPTSQITLKVIDPPSQHGGLPRLRTHSKASSRRAGTSSLTNLRSSTTLPTFLTAVNAYLAPAALAHSASAQKLRAANSAANS